MYRLHYFGAAGLYSLRNQAGEQVGTHLGSNKGGCRGHPRDSAFAHSDQGQQSTELAWILHLFVYLIPQAH